MNRYGPARRLIGRLIAGPRRRPYYEQAPYPYQQAPYPGQRRRGRFGMRGPIPFYSRRTRQGSEVSVGGCGCCLPIPLLVVLGLVGLVKAAVGAVRRQRAG